MKRILLQIIGAALLCAVLLCVCVRLSGNMLTLYFSIPPTATGVEVVFSPEDIITLGESRTDEENREIALSFRALKPGTADATVIWEGVEDGLYASELSMRMRSLSFGIITDSITYNFTGWQYMLLCVTLFGFSVSGIFLLSFLRELKNVCFSYRSTRYLGLAIFLFVISMQRVGDVVTFLQGKNAGTVWALIVSVVASAQTFMRWTAPVIVAFALVVALSNIVLMRHEGIRPSNMLGIAAAAAIIGGAALGIWLSYSHFTFTLRNVLCNVYAGLFAYFECLLAATVCCAVRAGRHTPSYDKDYVIVLGCKVRPDGSLYPLIRARVDRAIAFVKNQLAATGKRAVLVPSGGKGVDEPMAEAEAMAAYMVANGVPEEAILPETQSTTTRENLRFSRKLITEHSNGGKVAFSTSSYHVYRGGILAEETGWNIDGMGSKTKWYFWPNAFIREFIGLLVDSWIQQLAAAVIIILISALLASVM